MQLFPVGKIYDFMGKRRIFVPLTLLAVVASLVSFVYPGPTFGTDFRGGTEVEVAFKGPVEAGQLRDLIERSGFSTPDVVRVEDSSSDYRYMLRVQEVSSIDEAKQQEILSALCFGEGLPQDRCPAERSPSEVKFSPGGDKLTIRFRADPDLARIRQQLTPVEGVSIRAGENAIALQNAREHRVDVQLQSKGDQLMDALRQGLGAELVPDHPLRVEWIGPKAGAQLRDAAITSVLISLVFIMAYIALRFDVRFAPGATVALAHDALLTMGVLNFMGREITLTTVAALLTIIGYSVNDTVVVFDRVRENLVRMRGASFIKLINVSLSEMLSRTIITGGSTILALLAFFVRGTGTLKEFAFTLVIGMVLGIYSTIFIALPFTEWLDRTVFARVGKNKKKKSAPLRKADEAVV